MKKITNQRTGFIMNLVSLDILDLNYLYSNKSLKHLELPKKALPEKGLHIRIIKYFWRLLKAVKNAKRSVYRLSKSQTVFFVKSNNQKLSVEPIVNLIPNAYVLDGTEEANQMLPLYMAYLISIPFLPFVIATYYRASDYQKSTFPYIFEMYWLTYGYFVVVYWWLKFNKVKAVVVSNDHIMQNRTIVHAANILGITTIYIQHASVTKEFPPLKFSYALLEGMDSLKKYRVDDHSDVNIYLIGMIKADKYYAEINESKSVHRIGICVNHIDPCDEVEKLIKELRSKFPFVVLVLRPHPGDSKRLTIWKKMAQKYELVFSDSSTQDAFDFLTGVDSIISGESNILLEATMQNVYAICYDFSKQDMDWYGFCRNGLVDYYSHVSGVKEKVEQLIHAKPNVRIKAKYYCDTIDTIYDGNATSLAMSAIKSIICNNELDNNEWEKIDDIDIHANAFRLHVKKQEI
jgi:hypothetical protein